MLPIAVIIHFVFLTEKTIFKAVISANFLRHIFENCEILLLILQDEMACSGLRPLRCVECTYNFT
jgi:hypothetical protein